MPHAPCPCGEHPHHKGTGWSGRAHLQLTFIPAPRALRAVTPCHVCPGEGGVTAQGARGASSVTLGVALSCWHAALLHPAPPDPAVPLPIQLFRSCHRTWLWPRHGPCPAPLPLLPPILSPVSTLVSLVPTLYFALPSPRGKFLADLGPAAAFPRTRGGSKATNPRTFPLQEDEENPKKDQKFSL